MNVWNPSDLCTYLEKQNLIHVLWLKLPPLSLHITNNEIQEDSSFNSFKPISVWKPLTGHLLNSLQTQRASIESCYISRTPSLCIPAFSVSESRQVAIKGDASFKTTNSWSFINYLLCSLFIYLIILLGWPHYIKMYISGPKTWDSHAWEGLKMKITQANNALKEVHGFSILFKMMYDHRYEWRLEHMDHIVAMRTYRPRNGNFSASRVLNLSDASVIKAFSKPLKTPSAVKHAQIQQQRCVT